MNRAIGEESVWKLLCAVQRNVNVYVYVRNRANRFWNRNVTQIIIFTMKRLHVYGSVARVLWPLLLWFLCGLKPHSPLFDRGFSSASFRLSLCLQRTFSGTLWTLAPRFRLRLELAGAASCLSTSSTEANFLAYPTCENLRPKFESLPIVGIGFTRKQPHERSWTWKRKENWK